MNALGAVAQGQARRGLRNARANVDFVMSDASDRAGAVPNAAKDAVSSVGDTLADVIQERPVATLALALGLGFLIGRDLAPGTRSPVIMFERISRRWKKGAGGALWLVMIAAASIVAATVTVSFFVRRGFRRRV